MFNNYWWDGPSDFSKFESFKLLIPLIILDFILKGFALWRCSQQKQKIWFITLLFINSFGIYPAIYLILNPQKPKKK